MAHDPQLPSSPGDANRPAIADYELLRIIGQGSYGDVWLARGVTGVFRAVKVVWRNRFNDTHPFEREFKGLREFTAISLVEAHQLALLHVGLNDDAGFFYYVMELADDAVTGREIDPSAYVPLTLREMKMRRGRLPADECVALAAELSRALAGLHSRNLVHRDVKPSNVIIVGGVAKLADIGLVASSTDAHTFVGTEGFVAPEGPGEPAADVFSLGKLIYELSSGRDRKEYPRLPENLEILPDRKLFLELNEIVIRACDPSPGKRYPDAGAMLEDVQLLQAGRSVRRLRFMERRFRVAMRLALVLAAVAAVATGGAYVERRRLASETGRRIQAEKALEDLARKAFYAATIARAERNLETGYFGIARKILNEARPAPGQPDLRSFEWQSLWNQAQGDPATLLSQSGPALARVRYSPDGQLVAAQDSTGNVKVWQIATGRVQMEVKMPHAPYFAGFCSDGQWLLGVNENYALQRWSVVDGLPEATANTTINSPLAPLGPTRAITFVYSNNQNPHHVGIWDFPSHSEILSVPVPHSGTGSGTFYAAAVSPDGTRCALSLIFGKGPFAQWRLEVLDLTDGRILWDEAMSGRLSAMAFGPGGRMIACALSDIDELRLLDLERGAWGWRTAISGSATAVAYQDPGIFCVGGRGRGLQRIAVDTGKVVAALRGQAGTIADLATEGSTHQIASVSDSGELRLWSSASHPACTTYTGFWRAPGRQLSLSSDGRLLSATLDGHRVRIVDTGEPTTEPVDIEGSLAPILFTPDRSLWVLGLDGNLQKWRVFPNPALEASIKVAPSGSQLMGARGSRDARWIVDFDSNGHLEAVDTERGHMFASTEADPTGVFWVAVSGDGRWVAASGPRQDVSVWSLPGLRRTGLWHSDQRVTNGEFSPDGSVLALTLKAGTVQFHRTNDLSKWESQATSSGTSYGLAFHPTEPRLFVGGQDGVLHVFSTSDWSEILEMNADDPGSYPGTIITEASSADGSALAAYTESGMIRLWRR